MGDDEDKFLPNALMFQYGIETWNTFDTFSLRIFADTLVVPTGGTDMIKTSISPTIMVVTMMGIDTRVAQLDIGQIQTLKSSALVFCCRIIMMSDGEPF